MGNYLSVCLSNYLSVCRSVYMLSVCFVCLLFPLSVFLLFSQAKCLFVEDKAEVVEHCVCDMFEAVHPSKLYSREKTSHFPCLQTSLTRYLYQVSSVHRIGSLSRLLGGRFRSWT